MDNLFPILSQLQAAKYEYVSEHICNWSENPRPFSTIALMQKGKGRFVLNDSEILVNSSDVFFIPEGSKYKSYWYGQNGILYYAIHFHLENRYSDFSPQNFNLQKVTSPENPFLVSKFEQLCKYILNKDTLLKACGIFYDLYSNILPLLKAKNCKNDAYVSIKNAVEYIEKNSGENFNVAFLAKLSLISESRLYALFQKSIGCSPIAYRNNIRIRKAVNLLGENLSIEEIAEKVGFSSAVYFRRVFKDIMGKLPSEYKKSLQFNL